MDLGGQSRCDDSSVNSEQLHRLRIREVNTNSSLSAEEKSHEVSRLTSERNAAFLRESAAATDEEPPVKRHVKHNHGPCEGGCERAEAAEEKEEEEEEEQEEEPKTFSDVLCEACLQLESDGCSRKVNCKDCSVAVERAKYEHYLTYVRKFQGRFPGKNAKPCPHYERHCWLLAECCDRYYPCRRCHDEIVVDHNINRHNTKYVGCSHCGAEKQPAEEGCGNCGAQFAGYFCRVCRFYDDDATKPVYHCEHCGICRMGKGLGIDQHHCNRCKTCVPIEVADNHPCMDSSVQRDCPVCLVFMATSTEQVLFMRCGHAIHASCFEKYTKVKYNCPLCYKSLTDMSAWYRALDVSLEKDEMPPEYKNRRTHILCYDCDLKSVAKFHFKFHKCYKCCGYNTTVLSYFDLSDADARECEKHKPAAMAEEETREGAMRGSASGDRAVNEEEHSDSDEDDDSISGSSDDGVALSGSECASEDAPVVLAESPDIPDRPDGPSVDPSVVLPSSGSERLDSDTSPVGEAATAPTSCHNSPSASRCKSSSPERRLSPSSAHPSADSSARPAG